MGDRAADAEPYWRGRAGRAYAGTALVLVVAVIALQFVGNTAIEVGGVVVLAVGAVWAFNGLVRRYGPPPGMGGN